MAIDETTFWHDYELVGYEQLITLLSLQKSLRELITASRVSSGSRVLDAGCGTGFLLWMLQEMNLHPDVTGIDVTPAMLERAEAVCHRYDGHAVLHQANLNDPIAAWPIDGQFDVIFMINVLYIVKDPVDVLRKLASYLAPGGRIVVASPRHQPDMEAIETEHFELFARTGGNMENERARFARDLAPLKVPNRAIVSETTYHYPDRDEFLQYLALAGLRADSEPWYTYGEQNHAVVAVKRPT